MLDKRKHQLKSFDCGKAVMNDFLKRYASKNQALGLSWTWVLTDSSHEDGKAEVGAYYTLAFQSVEPAVFGGEAALPRCPTPAILLARLAVSRHHQGQKLGSKTLLAAMAQAVRLSEQGLPIFALILDVLDDDALNFYRQFSFFQPFEGVSDGQVRLFVPMAAIKQLL